MSTITAYGKFIKKGEDTYRTSTYLQWGYSERIIGACVMCNPGSAKEKEKVTFDEMVEIKLDQTMIRLKKLIEALYGREDLEGRFYIYNLFTLRNPKMKEALKRFKEIKEEDIMYQDYIDIQDKLKEIPWVLKAWGCEEDNKLIVQRMKWQELLQSKECIGKPGKNQNTFWHPLPKGTKRLKELEECLFNEFEEKNLKETLNGLQDA